MTREEAKKYLMDISFQIGTMGIESLTEKDGKKMREAIEALEQEPCGDVISRQVVKDKYKERLINNLKDDNRGIDLSEYAEEPYKAFCEFMDSIPSVTLEPKMGHWIEHPHECGENWEYPKYECSECSEWEENDSDYCPNCGCRMVESQESEDKK